MKEPFEIKGTWWLPNAEDTELPGILSFSQESGIFLDVVGVFGTVYEHMEDPEIILGLTQQGKPVTLYKCQNIMTTIPIAGGLGGGKFRVRFVFEGVHFESEADITLYQICGSYTDLDAWVNTYGFEIDTDITSDKFVSTVRYEQPPELLFDIDDNFVAGVGFSWQGPCETIVQTEVTISQRAYLTVKSKTGEIGFEKLFLRLDAFSCLLQVAAQRAIYPFAVFGLSKKSAQELINIYYQPIEALVKQESKIPQELLFTFKDLEAGQLKTWFASFEKYKIVIHLYRSLFYKDRLFIENRFLNIAQALESLHSIRFGNQELPTDVFNARRERVLAVIPEEDYEWAKRALNNANYKPFASKIQELLAKKSEYFVGLIDDIDVFANRVRNTRNKFIHLTKHKLIFKNGRELVDAISRMTLLFEIYLLDTIRFSDEKIRELTRAKRDSLLTGWKHLRSGVK